MVAFRIMELGCESLKADTYGRCECLSGVGEGEDEFDLDGGVEGKGVDADGGANVLAGFTEELEKELAGAVGNLGLLGERDVAIHECADAGDAVEAVEDVIAEGGD